MGLIILSITIVILIAVIITLIVVWSQDKKYLQELQDEYCRIKSTNETLNERNNNLQQSCNYVKQQLNVALTNNDNTVTELGLTLSAAKSRVEELNAQIADRTRDLNEMAAQLKKLHDETTEVNAQNFAAATQVQGYKDELEHLIKELADAKEIKRGVLLEENGDKEGRVDFELDNKEHKLIATIAEISALYPELTKDLATIEWKKIWLPKLQDAANANGLGVRGIYRLVLKEDENVCYVGQAVNIKERWYDHVKKMIGADTKGNEKLYKYRPEDFYWTVLEKGVADLNAAEKYWIEFYCCKEVGLNKKNGSI